LRESGDNLRSKLFCATRRQVIAKQLLLRDTYRMYHVYVLENQIDKSLYIGYTADINKRVKDHQEGRGGRTTKLKIGWTLIYYETYLNKKDVLGREKFLKGGSGRKYLMKQLKFYFEE
jgi:putative endonuclease